jgi:hypothetical protein
MRPIVLCLALSCTPATSSKPLTHQAYVWQRAWTPAVHNAVASHELDGLVLLAAEVSWNNGKAVIDRTGAPKMPAGLAVRIAAPPEHVDVASALSPLLRELSAAHPGVEIQLDMDLPTRQLPSYSQWIRDLRPITTNPLVVTALPTWLDSWAFADLARASDGFVLQVHWLDPNHPLGPLLQANAAQSVRRAASLGVPFRVALPAYGHDVWIAGDRVIGITSEDAAQSTSGATRNRVMADPLAVSTLLDTWRTSHPKALTGVLWFRLPTAQDQLAWSPITLSAVRRGEPLTSRHQTSIDPRPDAPDDLCVHSTGTLPWTPTPLSLPKVTMAGGRRGWRWSPARRALLPPPHVTPIQPGERRCVGWVRRGG